MRYQLIGVNHKSAPLEVRERLAIPESRLPDYCRDLTTHPGVEEGMVISTCNRVEMITHTTNGSADLRGFLHERFHLTSEELDAHLYEFREKDAVRHLFRVASSLDSMVVGEAQILGQVKEAYATARAVGAVRGQLDQLFTRAFAVAKRVRSETAVGSSSVSIASVAVELAKKIFGTLQGKNVFIVGAGKMSELAARHLMAHGCASIFVANRTYDRAIGLAQKFNGQAIKFDDLYDNCDRADIVITSTGAPHAIFRREHGEQFLARRKNRPMFFIDIAVPRDVSPEMAKLDGIFAYDIDDLQAAVSSHVADRRKEAELAEAIITAEVERFEARLSTLDVVPTIVSLQDHLETIRQAEIDRVRGRMGPMTPDQEMAVEALTRGIINKVMHTPITTLKTAAKEAEATTVIDVVRRLFNLRGKEEEPMADSEKKKEAESPSLMPILRIGSRGSQLALWQANYISSLLQARGHEVEIEIIHTTGDKITDVALAMVGTKGMFTKEIEEALAAGRVDLAVHSLKDLPTELPSGFEIAAITERQDPRDAFCSRLYSRIEDLPRSARVGTSSLRRQAQLKAIRHDLDIHSLRGNVDTRLRKLEQGEYDAIILAAAGLQRLGKTELIKQIIPAEIMCPAAGQGALGIEIREGDSLTRQHLEFLNDPAAHVATTCERALLNSLSGGCQVPIGAFAEIRAGKLHLDAIVADPDGSRVLRESRDGNMSDPEELGSAVGETLLQRGGDEILEAVYGRGFAVPPQP